MNESAIQLRISEYTRAIAQRDSCIAQLQHSLQVSLEQRDQLQLQAASSAEQLAEDVRRLRHQLQQQVATSGGEERNYNSANVDALKQQLAVLSRAKQSAEQQLSCSSRECHQLSEQLQQLQLSHDQLSNQLESRDALVQVLEQKLAESTSCRTEQLERLQEQLSMSRDELHNERSLNDSRLSELEQRDTSLLTAQSRLAQLTAQLHETAGQLQLCTQTAAANEQQLRKQVDELQGQASVAAAEERERSCRLVQQVEERMGQQLAELSAQLRERYTSELQAVKERHNAEMTAVVTQQVEQLRRRHEDELGAMRRQVAHAETLATAASDNTARKFRSVADLLWEMMPAEVISSGGVVDVRQCGDVEQALTQSAAWLKHDRQRLSAELNGERSRAEKAEQRCEQLERESQVVDSELKAVSAACQEKTVKIQQLTALIDSKTHQAERLQLALCESEERRQQLATRTEYESGELKIALENAERRATESQRSLEATQKESQDLRSVLAANEEQMFRLKKDASLDKDRLAVLSDQVSCKERRIDLLQQTLEKARPHSQNSVGTNATIATTENSSQTSAFARGNDADIEDNCMSILHSNMEQLCVDDVFEKELHGEDSTRLHEFSKSTRDSHSFGIALTPTSTRSIDAASIDSIVGDSATASPENVEALRSSRDVVVAETIAPGLIGVESTAARVATSSCGSPHNASMTCPHDIINNIDINQDTRHSCACEQQLGGLTAAAEQLLSNSQQLLVKMDSWRQRVDVRVSSAVERHNRAVNDLNQQAEGCTAAVVMVDSGGQQLQLAREQLLAHATVNAALRQQLQLHERLLRLYEQLVAAVRADWHALFAQLPANRLAVGQTNESADNTGLSLGDQSASSSQPASSADWLLLKKLQGDVSYYKVTCDVERALGQIETQFLLMQRERHLYARFFKLLSVDHVTTSAEGEPSDSLLDTWVFDGFRDYRANEDHDTTNEVDHAEDRGKVDAKHPEDEENSASSPDVEDRSDDVHDGVDVAAEDRRDGDVVHAADPDISEFLKSPPCRWSLDKMDSTVGTACSGQYLTHTQHQLTSLLRRTIQAISAVWMRRAADELHAAQGALQSSSSSAVTTLAPLAAVRDTTVDQVAGTVAWLEHVFERHSAIISDKLRDYQALVPPRSSTAVQCDLTSYSIQPGVTTSTTLSESRDGTHSPSLCQLTLYEERLSEVIAERDDLRSMVAGHERELIDLRQYFEQKVTNTATVYTEEIRRLMECQLQRDSSFIVDELAPGHEQPISSAVTADDNKLDSSAVKQLLEQLSCSQLLAQPSSDDHQCCNICQKTIDATLSTWRQKMEPELHGWITDVASSLRAKHGQELARLERRHLETLARTNAHYEGDGRCDENQTEVTGGGDGDQYSPHLITSAIVHSDSIQEWSMDRVAECVRQSPPLLPTHSHTRLSDSNQCPLATEHESGSVAATREAERESGIEGLTESVSVEKQASDDVAPLCRAPSPCDVQPPGTTTSLLAINAENTSQSDPQQDHNLRTSEPTGEPTATNSHRQHAQQLLAVETAERCERELQQLRLEAAAGEIRRDQQAARWRVELAAGYGCQIQALLSEVHVDEQTATGLERLRQTLTADAGTALADLGSAHQAELRYCQQRHLRQQRELELQLEAAARRERHLQLEMTRRRLQQDWTQNGDVHTQLVTKHELQLLYKDRDELAGRISRLRALLCALCQFFTTAEHCHSTCPSLPITVAAASSALSTRSSAAAAAAGDDDGASVDEWVLACLAPEHDTATVSVAALTATDTDGRVSERLASRAVQRVQQATERLQARQQQQQQQRTSQRHEKEQQDRGEEIDQGQSEEQWSGELAACQVSRRLVVDDSLTTAEEVGREERAYERDEAELTEALGEHVQQESATAASAAAATAVSLSRPLTATLEHIKMKAGVVLTSPRDPSCPRQLLCRCQQLETLLLELAAHTDHVLVEARRQTDDLAHQVACADSQLRSQRQFVDDLSAERETERDEFATEVARLQQRLTNTQRQRDEHAARRRDLEATEVQCRELSAALCDCQQERTRIHTELRAAVEKIGDLRDVIRSLEQRLDEALMLATSGERLAQLNNDLKRQMQLRKQLEDELMLCRCSRGRGTGTICRLNESSDSDGVATLASTASSSCVSVSSSVSSLMSVCPSLMDELRSQLEHMGRLVDESLEEHNCDDSEQSQSSAADTTAAISDSGVSASSESAAVTADNIDAAVTEAHRSVHQPTTAAAAAPDLSTVARHVRHIRAKIARLAAVKKAAVERSDQLQQQHAQLSTRLEDMRASQELSHSQLGEQLVVVSQLRAQLQQARLAAELQSQTAEQQLNCVNALKQQLSSAKQTIADNHREMTSMRRQLNDTEHQLTQCRSQLDDSNGHKSAIGSATTDTAFATICSTAVSESVQATATPTEWQDMQTKYRQLQTRHQKLLDRWYLHMSRNSSTNKSTSTEDNSDNALMSTLSAMTATPSTDDAGLPDPTSHTCRSDIRSSTDNISGEVLRLTAVSASSGRWQQVLLSPRRHRLQLTSSSPDLKPPPTDAAGSADGGSAAKPALLQQAVAVPASPRSPSGGLTDDEDGAPPSPALQLSQQYETLLASQDNDACESGPSVQQLAACVDMLVYVCHSFAGADVTSLDDVSDAQSEEVCSRVYQLQPDIQTDEQLRQSLEKQQQDENAGASDRSIHHQLSAVLTRLLTSYLHVCTQLYSQVSCRHNTSVPSRSLAEHVQQQRRQRHLVADLRSELVAARAAVTHSNTRVSALTQRIATMTATLSCNEQLIAQADNVLQQLQLAKHKMARQQKLIQQLSGGVGGVDRNGGTRAFSSRNAATITHLHDISRHIGYTRSHSTNTCVGVKSVGVSTDCSTISQPVETVTNLRSVGIKYDEQQCSQDSLLLRQLQALVTKLHQQGLEVLHLSELRRLINTDNNINNESVNKDLNSGSLVTLQQQSTASTQQEQQAHQDRLLKEHKEQIFALRRCVSEERVWCDQLQSRLQQEHCARLQHLQLLTHARCPAIACNTMQSDRVQPAPPTAGSGAISRRQGALKSACDVDDDNVEWGVRQAVEVVRAAGQWQLGSLWTAVQRVGANRPNEVDKKERAESVAGGVDCGNREYCEPATLQKQRPPQQNCNTQQIRDELCERKQQQITSTSPDQQQKRSSFDNQYHLEQRQHPSALSTEPNLSTACVISSASPLRSSAEQAGVVDLLYGRYLRSESYRRALCWQKRYLISLLGANKQHFLNVTVRSEDSALSRPTNKLRAVAWVVVAVRRMRYLVRRWRRSRGGVSVSRRR